MFDLWGFKESKKKKQPQAESIDLTLYKLQQEKRNIMKYEKFYKQKLATQKKQQNDRPSSLDDPFGSWDIGI